MGCTYPVPRDAVVDKTYVGRPFDNVLVRIFDPAGNQLPIGAVGEIHFAGGGIVKGYLDRPDLAPEAKAIGVLNQTGTLEPGKMADVVLWSADPFSVFARADLVIIDGALAFDRRDPRRQPSSDFELGRGQSR